MLLARDRNSCGPRGKKEKTEKDKEALHGACAAAGLVCNSGLIDLSSNCLVSTTR